MARLRNESSPTGTLSSMTPLLFQLAGGIGLFLLGMALMTDGLKAFAGESLRRGLVRFTGTPLKAFGSGALVTMMVQSSSATTITVIGFVSAGLLTFPQSIGVVMGASLGTTATGWLVSVLGLKVSVGFYALPVIGIGAFMKLLAKGRGRSLGLALAGFGLIFLGIDGLQEAMRGLSGALGLSSMTSTGLLSHLLAMVLGLVMTIIMQSSSAAVATILTALHTGSVNFEQAASIVIGAAIGTTFTGVLAAMGGSVPAKRTALAHVLFNLLTGLLALVLLPVFLRSLAWAQTHLGLEPGATSLAAFHTSFIALGAVIFLPLVRGFAGRIERLLPERDPSPTQNLDDSLLHAPTVALEATRRALRETARDLLSSLLEILTQRSSETDTEARRVRAAVSLDRIQQFLSRIPPVGEEPLSQLRLGQIHAIDHLTRLLPRLDPPESVRRCLTHDEVLPAIALCRSLLENACTGLGMPTTSDWLKAVSNHAQGLADLRRRQRPTVLSATSGGSYSSAEALDLLDAIRWLDRIGYHTWRLCHHLDGNHASERDGATPASAERSPN